MVGKKEKRNVCLCNVWSPVNYVNTPTRCLETRETLLHLFLFPLYSSLSLPLSSSSHRQAVGGKVEGGGKVKIQRYYFSHAQYAATYVYVCLACSFDDCLPVEERLPLERFK